MSTAVGGAKLTRGPQDPSLFLLTEAFRGQMQGPGENDLGVLGDPKLKEGGPLLLRLQQKLWGRVSRSPGLLPSAHKLEGLWASVQLKGWAHSSESLELQKQLELL